MRLFFSTNIPNLCVSYVTILKLIFAHPQDNSIVPGDAWFLVHLANTCLAQLVTSGIHLQPFVWIKGLGTTWFGYLFLHLKTSSETVANIISIIFFFKLKYIIFLSGILWFCSSLDSRGLLWSSQNEISKVADTRPVLTHFSISWVASTAFLFVTREEPSLDPLSMHSGWNPLLPWPWNLSCPVCWKSPGLNLSVAFPELPGGFFRLPTCLTALVLQKPCFWSYPLLYVCHIPHSSLASWIQH